MQQADTSGLAGLLLSRFFVEPVNYASGVERSYLGRLGEYSISHAGYVKIEAVIERGPGCGVWRDVESLQIRSVLCVFFFSRVETASPSKSIIQDIVH